MSQKLRLALLLLTAILVSCDLRSETAKKEMEKFSGTPTPVPAYSISPEPTPVDPADVAAVDTMQLGDPLTADGHQQHKTLNCTKYNPVTVNGNESVVTVKGVCRRVMINGDGNQVSVEAAMEFVFNGTNNRLTFSKFANGKQPLVTQNMQGNTVEQGVGNNSPPATKTHVTK
ncbi:MAG: DUF3060 domain-containing protein [Acidobacteria bacterium]|nr:DUF3060 domain-containing protein [Acidobacteriota bacterium]